MPSKGQPQEILGKWKSLIQGNPSYREIIHTSRTPRKYKGDSLAKGNQSYKEIPYKGKSLIQGNPLHVETLVK